ncbi:MAG: asparaginase [Candidatus Cloacimonetes bacterium]|nr:asparaginase [Candidatus Cloacimonadota bacterium]
MQPKRIPGVLVIYTGGTIGSWPRDPQEPLSPLKPTTDIKKVMGMLPFYDPDNSLLRLENVLVPVNTYSLHEPLDSARIQVCDWQNLARLIYNNYNDYSGFVILHGTDTLAYTASALSFMLPGLNKPVVLTGAQRPIGQSRSDAVQNLMTAIEIAAQEYLGNPPIPEVSVFFGDRLLRGNRSTKISSRSYGAFVSPCFPSLGKSGVRLQIRRELILKPKTCPLQILEKIDPNLVCFDLFPGMNFSFMQHICNTPGLRGIILKSFGSGNTPETGEFLDAIKNASDSGKIVVNVSQCLEAEVMMGKYESSAKLKDLGVISAHDMTFEAALTKLFVLLGQEDDITCVKKQFGQEIAGEMLRETA